MRRPGEAPAGTRELIVDITDPATVGQAAAGIESSTRSSTTPGSGSRGRSRCSPPGGADRQLDVNVVGQLRVTQALPARAATPEGRIVLMGSISGRSALPFLGAYAMCKFALEAMADALRVELAPWGIHVSIVEPGTIATPIWTKPQRSAAELPSQAAELYGARLDRFRSAAAARSAAHAVPADEVAKAVEHALTAKRPQTRIWSAPTRSGAHACSACPIGCETAS